jgi:hypothetical protein
MRELTDQAASIAAQSDGRALLRDHGGGFSPATVELHRTACPVMDRHRPRVRELGRREECVSALLAAEREAPEEAHARPAVRDLVSSLLVTGRTGPELRGLAGRCGIT